MIDSEGFRANVGIIITNAHGHVFWGRRVGKDAWQFPQGGMLFEENPLDAMYRELKEEVGLHPADVAVISESSRWYSYRLPKQFIRYHSKPLCIGQKQKWFLLRLKSGDDHVYLNSSDEPEFDRWRWVDYWYPLEEVIFFKRHVYQQVLQEFSPLLVREFDQVL